MQDFAVVQVLDPESCLNEKPPYLPLRNQLITISLEPVTEINVVHVFKQYSYEVLVTEVRLILANIISLEGLMYHELLSGICPVLI
jgi:hypothetical protein